MRSPKFPSVALAALCGMSAQCQAQDWYAGIAAGMARHAETSSFTPAFTTTSDASDERDAAMKLLLGRRFGTHLSLELAYVDYGKLTRQVSGTFGAFHVGARGAHYTFERRQKGFTLGLVGEYPVAPQVTVHAGLGIAAMRADTRFVSVADEVFWAPRSEMSGNVRASDTALHAMLGAGWSPTRDWTMRLEAEYVGRVGSAQTLAPPTSGETATTAVMFSILRRF